MKPLPILLSTALCAGLWAFTGGPKKSAPPGTVRVNDSLFADRAEIGNRDWREYLFWKIQFEAPGAADATLPDTCWLRLDPDEGPGQTFDCGFGAVYFRHPAFSFYPVVGITHAQAEAFCRWRSDRVNELIAREPGRWAFRKVTYRLPTEAEWMQLAAGNADLATHPFGTTDTAWRKGNPSVNWGGRRSWNDRRYTTFPSTATWPVFYNGGRKSPFRNLVGNVAEMLAEPGIAKGGHYGLPPDSCRVSARVAYRGAAPWLGFRSICVVTY